jgi:hypothetical protein
LVRAVDPEFGGTQPWQTQQQVVSLCTPVTWWIDSIRRGWYQWKPELGAWDIDVEGQTVMRRIYGLS